MVSVSVQYLNLTEPLTCYISLYFFTKASTFLPHIPPAVRFVDSFVPFLIMDFYKN